MRSFCAGLALSIMLAAQITAQAQPTSQDALDAYDAAESNGTDLYDNKLYSDPAWNDSYWITVNNLVCVSRLNTLIGDAAVYAQGEDPDPVIIAANNLAIATIQAHIEDAQGDYAVAVYVRSQAITDCENGDADLQLFDNFFNTEDYVSAIAVCEDAEDDYNAGHDKMSTCYSKINSAISSWESADVFLNLYGY